MPKKTAPLDKTPQITLSELMGGKYTRKMLDNMACRSPSGVIEVIGKGRKRSEVLFHISAIDKKWGTFTEGQIKRSQLRNGLGVIDVYPTPSESKRKRLECKDPQGALERAAAMLWMQENEYRPFGGSLLSGIAGDQQEPVSNRDRKMLAAMAQWLVTNCGRCFMDQLMGATKEIANKQPKQNRKTPETEWTGN